MDFSEVQIVEVSFGHLCWNLQGFSKNWKVLFLKTEFYFALSKSQRPAVIEILTTLIMARKQQPLTQSTWVVTSPSSRKRL